MFSNRLHFVIQVSLVNVPIDTTSSKSYFLTFVRRGTLGPLAGKNLDSWFVMPVRGGLAVKSDNLDTAYFSGLVTRPGEFLLQKKQ